MMVTAKTIHKGWTGFTLVLLSIFIGIGWGSGEWATAVGAIALLALFIVGVVLMLQHLFDEEIL